MLLSALLGPYAGFLTMNGVLLIQCLFLRMEGCSHSAVMCGTWHFMVALSEHYGRAEYGLLRDDSGWGISGKQTVSAADSVYGISGDF